MRVRRDTCVYIEQQEPMWKFARVQIGLVIHAIRDLAHWDNRSVDIARFSRSFRICCEFVFAIYRRWYADTGIVYASGFVSMFKKEEKDSMREF